MMQPPPQMSPEQVLDGYDPEKFRISCMTLVGDRAAAQQSMMESALNVADALYMAAKNLASRVVDLENELMQTKAELEALKNEGGEDKDKDKAKVVPLDPEPEKS